jgi:hypothetical protein
VADRLHIANIQKLPAKSRINLCEAAQDIMINMRDALHLLARSGILEGAGRKSKYIQAFCQALFCIVYAAVYNTAKLYEHC